MISATIPQNEKDRLILLKSLEILDSEAEIEYDEITKIASSICDTPISLITLIDQDRQWFKSKIGLDVDSTPRDHAFCAHGINNPTNPLIVSDATQDIRFHDNPLVTDNPNIRFYAGVPLVTNDGIALGSLCVIDNKPREISQEKLKILKFLSKQVVKLIELRRANILLRKSESELKVLNLSLQDFAHVVSHDLKAPIRQIHQYAQLIIEDLDGKDLGITNKFLDTIDEAALEALYLIDGILRYSKSINSYDSNRSNISITSLIDNIINNYDGDGNVKSIVCLESDEIFASRIVLIQILNNLISNAIKYNDKNDGFLRIFIKEDQKYYYFDIEDNGIGIPEDKFKNIFKLFFMVEDTSLTHINRNGIGLNIVKKLVRHSGGELKVKSELGKGSTFSFNIAKRTGKFVE